VRTTTGACGQIWRISPKAVPAQCLTRSWPARRTQRGGDAGATLTGEAAHGGSQVGEGLRMLELGGDQPAGCGERLLDLHPQRKVPGGDAVLPVVDLSARQVDRIYVATVYLEISLASGPMDEIGRSALSPGG
jgi:hypothetical protein